MNTPVTYAKLANAITTTIIIIVSSTLGTVGVGSAAHNSSQYTYNASRLDSMVVIVVVVASHFKYCNPLSSTRKADTEVPTAMGRIPIFLVPLPSS